MKLALSNIAWAREDDDAVASLMRRHMIDGVEIAPTTVWPAPLEATSADIDALRNAWADRGIRIVALQALLFGKPELTLFESEARRRATLDYLTGMMDLAARLGAKPMVFGSPKNRLLGGMDRAHAGRVAEDFFRKAADRAAQRGVELCIEPNPAAYGCDFVNTTMEGVNLVELVHREGFGLHLDGGALALNAEPVGTSIEWAKPWLRHFHASEPNLAPYGTGGSDHAAYAAALRKWSYAGWVSVEMRQPPGGVQQIAEFLPRFRDCYGG